ncbi:MAG TPA: four helix bundle protein [Candidatus Saccharimonadales bacterium]|nr:four helix bundle protein [Candidatus Saccharimonadales bacterium]
MADKYEKLPIFKEAHQLVLQVYKLTKTYPTDEKFGIISQIRRSSSSIIANIIEGNARGYRKEFINFLLIANGSLEETKYFLLLSKDLGYITEIEYLKCHDQTETVGKQLNGLIKYLKVNQKVKSL